MSELQPTDLSTNVDTSTESLVSSMEIYDVVIKELIILLAFPELKQESGEVLDCLTAVGASENILELWQEVVGMAIKPEEDEGY